MNSANTSRRGFLRQASLGVAAVGAVAAVPSAILGKSASAGAAPAAVALEAPMVAVLRDSAKGEFTLMIGEREVGFTDKAMAARLSHAVRQA